MLKPEVKRLYITILYDEGYWQVSALSTTQSAYQKIMRKRCLYEYHGWCCALKVGMAK